MKNLMKIMDFLNICINNLILQGNLSEYKLIKLTGYRDTRFSVLYKFVDAWEVSDDNGSFSKNYYSI